MALSNPDDCKNLEKEEKELDEKLKKYPLNTEAEKSDESMHLLHQYSK
jgi:hypothetical protein